MLELELEIEQDEEFELEQDNTPYVRFRNIYGEVEENQEIVNYVHAQNEPIIAEINKKVPIDTRLTNSQIHDIFN